MIAELDPALAARLHGYGPDAGWDSPLCRHPGPWGVRGLGPGWILRAHGEAGQSR
jgi:hypothetical protein